MSSFAIIPAVDLKDGHCVRLRQGLAQEQTIYSEDPVRMAQHWEAEGATWLHVVDLDGAFEGRPVHTELIKKIVNVLNIPVQVGGGLRTNDDIQRLIDAGVSRVILGTRACQAEEDLAMLVSQFKEKLAVALDVRNGKIQIEGWTETTDLDALSFATRISRHKVQTLIYTDTAADGMQSGINISAVEALCEKVSCSVIASGGISSAEDISTLQKLSSAGLIGAIVGKALYEGTVSFKALQALC